MTLFTSIVFILFYQIIIVHGQLFDGNFLGGDAPSDLLQLPSNSVLGIPEDFTNALNDYSPGRTFQFADLYNMITDSKVYDDQCEFQLRSDVDNFLGDRLIIGQLSNINQIINAQISFHDDNGDLIRDDYGDPILYTSSRQELGHVLDILHQGFAFSYAQCLLKLQPNSDFDLHSLFFHFAQSSSLSTTTSRNKVLGTITGPTSFSIDLVGLTYNVSTTCPLSSTCMWLLDDTVISTLSNSTVVLTFEQTNIGNRTLSYVAYAGNIPRTLASLLLSILPTTRQVCNRLPRLPKNRWLQAGNMSSPRAYFTVTYLAQSGCVMITGGTADGSTALSLVDIYDPSTGCYNTSNMTYPRMKHTATYFNNSDMVIVIGGFNNVLGNIPQSELISINSVQLYRSMVNPRYFHEIGSTGSNILVVSGQGFDSRLRALEMYNRSSSTFQQLMLSDPLIENLEGHSATILGNSGSTFIFGGYNGTTYSSSGLIAGTMNLTSAIVDEEDTAVIEERAHHQAIYMPEINSVLITGGDNGTNTFATCYLYDINSKTFNITGSMEIQRSFHTAVRLSNGSVLVIGGAVSMNNYQPATVTNSVERYDFTTRTFTLVASLNVARYRHKAIFVPSNNEVFVFGGIDPNSTILSSFEYIISDSSS